MLIVVFNENLVGAVEMCCLTKLVSLNMMEGTLNSAKEGELILSLQYIILDD